MELYTECLSQLSTFEFVSEYFTSLYDNLNIPLHNLTSCYYGELGLSSPLLNGVVRCTTNEIDLKATVDTIFNYFQKRNLPHSWWTEISIEPLGLKKLLETNGLHLMEEKFPGMMLDIASVTQQNPSSVDLDITIVSNEREFQQWSQVISSVYEFSDSDAQKY